MNLIFSPEQLSSAIGELLRHRSNEIETASADVARLFRSQIEAESAHDHALENRDFRQWEAEMAENNRGGEIARTAIHAEADSAVVTPPELVQSTVQDSASQVSDYEAEARRKLLEAQKLGVNFTDIESL